MLAPVSCTCGASAPCSGLVPSVLAVCLVGVPMLPLSAAMPRCGRGGAAVIEQSIRSLSPPSAPCVLADQVVGGVLSPPRPNPSSLGLPLPVVFTPGGLSPRSNSATPGVSVPCSDSTPPPTPWQDHRGFSATLEDLRPPSLSPTFQRTHGPLQKPCGPCHRPALPRICQPGFSAGLCTSPCLLTLPHGIPTLPPCCQQRRGLSQCRPRRPMRPHIALPRRFPTSPTQSPSASLSSTPPPLLSSPLPPSSILPIQRRSTQHSCLRSPPVPPPSRGTPPILRCCLPYCGDFPGPVLRAPVPLLS